MANGVITSRCSREVTDEKGNEVLLPTAAAIKGHQWTLTW